MLALAELVQGYARPPSQSVQVDGLVEDSRQVVPGNGYLALQGAANDGHAFAPDAVARGAVAVLAERAIDDLDVPVCVVPDLMQRRSALAARAYGDASATLNSVAVTGTNGKTSVAHYVAQLTHTLGERCGYMGTLGWGELPKLAEAKLTTVDACSVQERLARLRHSGCTRVAMEVSSHALVQDRVAAVQFDSALFTNLSRDHLDYHGSMENYAAAKRQLFDFPCLQRIVTNVDDACGRAIGEAQVPGSARVWTYGSGSASVSWRDIQVRGDGFTGRWHTAWGDAPLPAAIAWTVSIANVAAAMTLLLAEGYPLARLADSCAQLATVPGRMEHFANPAGAAVVVDFAHTPDALQQATASLREHCAGKLHLVFGCGGDRDRGKRAQMGRVAAKGADRLWVTDDNPRTEDPEQIVADILTGLPASCQAEGRVQVCHERDQAIAAALRNTQPQDIVLVAGKGHEAYQDRDGQRTSYSDQACVRRLLANRKSRWVEMSVKPQRTLILGLGITGESCVRHLAATDELTVFDTRPQPPRGAEIQAEHAGVRFHFGATQIDLTAFDRVVVSPGIPDDHCLLRQAQQLELPLLNDIDLFCLSARAPIYAITGTNGKSTVTTLVGEMLAAQGAKIGVGGNLGTPALDLLDAGCDAYVLELSSFQLQRLGEYSFAAATILNLSEDHLDRHGSMQAYTQAKQQIYRAAQLCVSNRDDLATQPKIQPNAGITFGSSAPLDGHYGLSDQAAAQCLMFGSEVLLRTDELSLPGEHNALNVLAALALTDASAVPRADRCAVAAAFAGLPHRGEVVAQIGGVRFVNDSKATNVGATIAALEGMSGAGGAKLLVLLGGQSKGVDLSPLAPVVGACCSHALVFGDCANELQQLLAPELPVTLVTTLQQAVTTAFALAKPGQTIVLSPACASFDMFRSFADRGEQFSALVRELAASQEAQQ